MDATRKHSAHMDKTVLAMVSAVPSRRMTPGRNVTQGYHCEHVHDVPVRVREELLDLHPFSLVRKSYNIPELRN